MSHPAWVCGLKPMIVIYHFFLCGSHPAWVCGLKQGNGTLPGQDTVSHPAWVCGLKHVYAVRLATCDKVTPCVGVWIET